jgi:hypothetical protein
MKALKISLDEWQKIIIEIAKHHPRSVWMIRPNMRRILGFTPREHEEWITFDRTGSKNETQRKYLKKTIHLDFYDEAQRTMFLLKYSNFIDTNKDDRQIY